MKILNSKEVREYIEKLMVENEQVRTIIKKYKNQPALLESVLESVIEELMVDVVQTKYDMVDPKIFLEDPYFCGYDQLREYGVAKDMFPILKEDFIEVHRLDAPYREVIIEGGIGIGKSFFASLGQVWHLYFLSCLKSPQKYFKIAQSAKISLTTISITEKQSKKNIFYTVKEMIKNIPYFKEQFMYDIKRATDSLLFPNNIEIFNGTSSISATIGLNIFSAVLDEANFFKVIERSNRAKDSSGQYDEAMELYYNLLRRQESRYLKEGLKPGLLYLCSSSQYPDDFTSRRLKAAKESSKNEIYHMHYATWEVKREQCAKETFHVEIGGLNRRSRILKGNETDIQGDIIEVPMNFHSQFAKDIENAIRDLAGIALYSVQPFFGQKEYIQEMFDMSLPRIFSTDKATLSAKPEYVAMEKILGKPKFFPERSRYLAIDIGLKKDRTGLALGYIEDISFMQKEFYNEMTGKMDSTSIKLPKIVIEMVLQIYPEAEFGEVELARIRFLIFQLKKFGYRIKYASADGFQSADMQQILKRNGIEFEYISMDKTTEPYETFRTAVYEKRVRCFYNSHLEMEMNQLEKNYVLDKVDHPKGGASKDLSDAVGQLVYNCHVNTHFMDDSLLPPEGAVEDDSQIENESDKILRDFEKWARE